MALPFHHAKHWDADTRYMALRTLTAAALADPQDVALLKKVLDIILERINEDSVGEIQAEALRSLGTLLPVLPNQIVIDTVKGILAANSIPTNNNFAIFKVIVNGASTAQNAETILIPAMCSLLSQNLDQGPYREALQVLVSLSKTAPKKAQIAPAILTEALNLLLTLTTKKDLLYKEDAALGVSGFAAALPSDIVVQCLLSSKALWSKWDVALAESAKTNNTASIEDALPCLEAISQCLKGMSLPIHKGFVDLIESRLTKAISTLRNANRPTWIAVHLRIYNRIPSSFKGFTIDDETVGYFLTYGAGEEEDSIDMSDIDELDDVDANGFELPDSWTVRYEAVGIAEKRPAMIPTMIKQLNVETNTNVANLIVDCLAGKKLPSTIPITDLSLSNEVNLTQKLRFFKLMVPCFLDQSTRLADEVLKQCQTLPPGAMTELLQTLLEIDSSLAAKFADCEKLWQIDSPKTAKLLVAVISKLRPLNKDFVYKHSDLLRDLGDILTAVEVAAPEAQNVLYHRLTSCLKASKSLHPREFRKLVQLCSKSSHEALDRYLSSQTVSLFLKDAVPIEDIRDALGVLKFVELPAQFFPVVQERANQLVDLTQVSPLRVAALFDLLRFTLRTVLAKHPDEAQNCYLMLSNVLEKLMCFKGRRAERFLYPYHPVPSIAFKNLIQDIINSKPEQSQNLTILCSKKLADGKNFVQATLAWYGLAVLTNDKMKISLNPEDGSEYLSAVLECSCNHNRFLQILDEAPSLFIITVLQHIARNPESRLDQAATERICSVALSRNTDESAEIVALLIQATNELDYMIQKLISQFTGHLTVISLALSKCNMPKSPTGDPLIKIIKNANCDSLEEKRARMMALERFAKQGLLSIADQKSEINYLIESNELCAGDVSQKSVIDFGAFKKTTDLTVPYRRAAWEFIATCRSNCPDVVKTAVELYCNSEGEDDLSIKEVVNRCSVL